MTDATPNGIVSFEFCGFDETCETALALWGMPGQHLALLSLGLDYLFLVAYPGLICLGLLLILSRVPDHLQHPTRIMAATCAVVAAADAIENYALIRIVLEGITGSYGLVAGIFASIKFALLAVVLGWLIYLAVRYLRQ